MKLRREYRDRNETEIAVLEALADRHEEGMTVFELRSVLEVDIERLESALSGLRHSGLVSVREEEDRMVFVVDASALEPEAESGVTDVGFLEWLRHQLGL